MQWIKGKLGYDTKQKDNDDSSSSDDDQSEQPLTSEQLVQSLQMKRMLHLKNARKIEGEAREAHSNGQVNRARTLLRQKQVIDSQINDLDGQIANAQHRSLAYDSAATSAATMRSMKKESRKMERMIAKVDISDVDDLVDKVDDLSTQSYEVSSVLSRPSSSWASIPGTDDDNIDSILDQWSDLPNKPHHYHTSVDMPDVPDTIPKQRITNQRQNEKSNAL